MLASFPIATNDGAPITGTNRDEFIFNHMINPATAALSYPASSLDQGQAMLTVRQCEATRASRFPRPLALSFNQGD